MTRDPEWKAAADEMANKLVASLNPDARLAGGIRFLRNPIKNESTGVPNSIVVNGCGGQCRFGVYREHHGLVKENALGQKSWRFFSNDGAPGDAYDPESIASAPTARAAIGSVAVGGFLRHVIGIAADAPTETLYFRVDSLARHGVLRLRVGRRVASIVCEARRSADDPCDVTIECDGPIGVVVAAPWAEFPMPRVEAGAHKFRLMRPPGSNP